MIAAAIYARVSHKDEGDDRTRSVARQVQDARAYATRKGWTVPDKHVYVDDEVSAVDWGKRHAWARSGPPEPGSSKRAHPTSGLATSSLRARATSSGRSSAWGSWPRNGRNGSPATAPT